MDTNYQGPFCQSCGMPLTKDEELGTNKDGSKNPEYCVYCYENGGFKDEMTMEQMIDFCVDYGMKEGIYTDPNAAKAQMLAWFPTLKRWKQA